METNLSLGEYIAAAFQEGIAPTAFRRNLRGGRSCYHIGFINHAKDHYCSASFKEKQ